MHWIPVALELTVLGNAGRYLAPLSGGSAYLVEEGDTRVLLDAGGGARAALEAMGVERLDAVVLSHFHFDHVQDLVTLRGIMDARTITVIPPGEAPRLQAFAQAYAFDGPWKLDGPLVEAREPLRVGPLTLTFAPTQHSAPSFATRIEGPAASGASDGADGRARTSSIVYASDAASSGPLQALAARADLLLMHALIPTVEPDSEHARIHATAETAGALAAKADARRLLLSHRYWESPDAAMREAASRSFGRVELARDRAGYPV